MFYITISINHLSFFHFMKLLNRTEGIEKYIARKNDRLPKHDKKWMCHLLMVIL